MSNGTMDTEGSSAAAAATAAAGEAPAEPCPPPLEWQEVLREFHAQADAWYLDRPRYRISGRTLGTGRPLYLLGGFGGTHELYALFVWLMRDRFRCVLWDYPGTATGTPVLHDLALGELAADVRAIAETCGDREIDLYAPSFGSLVALETMLDAPSLVRRSVLQGGFAHRALSPFERWLARSSRFFPASLSRFPGSRAVRAHNHRRWFPPFDETRWDFLEGNAGRVPVPALAWQARLIGQTDLRPRLGEIDKHVLLIETEGEGAATRECMKELASGLPHARSETMLMTGQYPYLTHPHRLAKIVAPFLEGDAP